MFSWGYNLEFVIVKKEDTNEQCTIPYCSIYNYGLVVNKKSSLCVTLFF